MNKSFKVKSYSGALLAFAIAIPSKPTCTSVTLSTPFLIQASNSLFLIRRDAFATSGVSIPAPEQNNLIPPPVPVDSTLGAGLPVFFANCSATAVEKGYTVEEPTISILSRAWAAVAEKAKPAAMTRTSCFMYKLQAKHL